MIGEDEAAELELRAEGEALARDSDGEAGGGVVDEDELGDECDADPSEVTEEDGGADWDFDFLDDDAFLAEGGGVEVPPEVAFGIGAGGGLPGSMPGSSGGPDGPPLPPPLDAPPPPELAARNRNAPPVVVHVPGGKLTYYCTAKSEFCVAECLNKRHGRCSKTRTMRKGGPPRKNRAQGRPIGYLAAWLRRGMDLNSKAAHWDDLEEPPKTDRRAARNALKADDEQDVALLFSGEATPPAGSDSEPSGIA